MMRSNTVAHIALKLDHPFQLNATPMAAIGPHQSYGLDLPMADDGGLADIQLDRSIRWTRSKSDIAVAGFDGRKHSIERAIKYVKTHPSHNVFTFWKHGSKLLERMKFGAARFF
jgi:hypothetical protein